MICPGDGACEHDKHGMCHGPRTGPETWGQLRGLSYVMPLSFDYENWRGEEHHYIVRFNEIQTADGQVMLHGDLVTRDGDLREGMGGRRRSFEAARMRNVRDATCKQCQQCGGWFYREIDHSCGDTDVPVAWRDNIAQVKSVRW